MEELYLQYHNLNKEYKRAKREYEKALEKKALYLYSVLPGSTDFSKEKMAETVSDKFLNYTIKIAEIDKEIEVRRNLSDNLLYRTKLKGLELRDSKEVIDRIYVYYFIDRISVRKFCRLLNYSKSQVYRLIEEIEKKLKMGQNGTNGGL